MPVTRRRLFSLRPVSQVAVALMCPGSPLNLLMAKRRLPQRQFATAAPRSRSGDGPAPPPSGGGSSATMFGTFSPKSTRKLYFSWRVIVTELVSLISLSRASLIWCDRFHVRPGSGFSLERTRLTGG